MFIRNAIPGIVRLRGGGGRGEDELEEYALIHPHWSFHRKF